MYHQHQDMNCPSGLDLLSAAVGARRADHLPILARSSSNMSSSSSSAVASSNSNPPKAEALTLPEAEALKEIIATHQAQQAMITQARAIRTKKDRVKSFPQILMEILSNPDYASIISWLPSGKSFAIHDPNLFASLILPKYFRSQTIFRSFARKLNRWGFLSVKRELNPINIPTFEHGYFLRDFPELCGKMHHCRTTDQIAKASEAIADAGFSPSYGAPSPSMNDIYRKDQFMPPDKKLYPESSSESSLHALVNANTALAQSYGSPSLALSTSFQASQEVKAAAASYIMSSMRRNINEEFPRTDSQLNDLENELLVLREMKRQKQRMLERQLHEMSVVKAMTEAEVDDKVTQLLAANNRKQVDDNVAQLLAANNGHHPSTRASPRGVGGGWFYDPVRKAGF